MNRVNYLVSRFERFAGVAAPALDAGVRVPLATLGGAVLLAATLSGVEELRLHAVRTEGERLAAEAFSAAQTADRARALAREVERLRGLTDRVDAMRESGDARADELAAIGNGVPRDAWLAAVRIDRGAYTIDGRSLRLAAVSATMSALSTLGPFGGAKLLAVHQDTGRGDVSYSIALEPRR